MSRQQMVDSYFWQDPWIRKQDPARRYLFLWLLTNPRTNIAGIYEVTANDMAHETNIDQDKLKTYLAGFRKDGKVFQKREWIIMRNWPKRQNINSPKVKAGIARIISALPTDIQDYLVSIDYQLPWIRALLDALRGERISGDNREKYGIDTVSIPYRTTLHYTERSAAVGIAEPTASAPAQKVRRFPQVIHNDEREEL